MGMNNLQMEMRGYILHSHHFRSPKPMHIQSLKEWWREAMKPKVIAKCTCKYQLTFPCKYPGDTKWHNSWERCRELAKGDYRLHALLYHHWGKHYTVFVTKDPRKGVPFCGYLLPANWFNVEYMNGKGKA